MAFEFALRTIRYNLGDWDYQYAISGGHFMSEAVFYNVEDTCPPFVLESDMANICEAVSCNGLNFRYIVKNLPSSSDIHTRYGVFFTMLMRSIQTYMDRTLFVYFREIDYNSSEYSDLNLKFLVQHVASKSNQFLNDNWLRVPVTDSLRVHLMNLVRCRYIMAENNLFILNLFYSDFQLIPNYAKVLLFDVLFNMQICPSCAPTCAYPTLYVINGIVKCGYNFRSRDISNKLDEELVRYQDDYRYTRQFLNLAEFVEKLITPDTEDFPQIVLMSIILTKNLFRSRNNLNVWNRPELSRYAADVIVAKVKSVLSLSREFLLENEKVLIAVAKILYDHFVFLGGRSPCYSISFIIANHKTREVEEIRNLIFGKGLQNVLIFPHIEPKLHFTDPIPGRFLDGITFDLMYYPVQMAAARVDLSTFIRLAITQGRCPYSRATLKAPLTDLALTAEIHEYLSRSAF